MVGYCQQTNEKIYSIHLGMPTSDLYFNLISSNDHCYTIHNSFNSLWRI